jgi:beta-glucosidase
MTPVYLDPAAPLAVRVEAILALMTDEQKLSCLNGVPAMTLADGFRLPAAGCRLPAAGNDGVEGLHGSGHHRDATLFPQAVGLGSTWNAALLEAVGEAVAVETRARDPRAFRVFGPVQDVRSNPLAGRYEEGYGEDPFLCGRLGTAYAFGLKGRHPLYIRTKPELKHFFGYNHEWRRARASSSMSCRAMHEFQLVPYRMPVEAGAVLGAMTAYNLVNGVPAIIHPMMWTLREGARVAGGPGTAGAAEERRRSAAARPPLPGPERTAGRERRRRSWRGPGEPAGAARPAGRPEPARPLQPAGARRGPGHAAGRHHRTARC